MARRGSGEGSIYQRANGRWIAYTRLSDGRKKFFSGATRRDVQRQLAQALHAQQEGTLVTVRDASVAQYLERWLAAIEPSVRVRTHESYALNVRRLIPHLGRGRLSALEPAAIQACYAKLLHRGLSARSVEQAHTVLHNALRQAVRWNLLARNPAEAVTAPGPGAGSCWCSPRSRSGGCSRSHGMIGCIHCGRSWSPPDFERARRLASSGRIWT